MLIDFTMVVSKARTLKSRLHFINSHEFKLIHDLKERQEAEENPYRPEINPISRYIAETKLQQSNSKVHDRLIDMGKKYDERKHLYKALKDEYESQTFRPNPKINEVSRRIDMEKSRAMGEDLNISRHELLYNHAKNHLQNLKQSPYARQPSFTPSTTPYDSELCQLSFMERQYIDCSNRELKAKLIEEQNSRENIRQYMHPRVNQYSSEAGDSFGEGSVQRGRALYERAMKSHQKLQIEREKKKREEKERANEQKTLATSSEAIKNRTVYRLKELFELLDDDGDGILTAQKINVEGLERDICRIVSPVIIQLEDKIPQMDFELFFTLMQEFMKVKRP